MAYNQQVKTKLQEYFMERWGMWEYTRGWLKGDCPLCGKDKKLGVQIEENKAHCFSCDFRMTTFRFIMEIENLNQYNEVYNLLKKYNGTTSIYSVSNEPEREAKHLQLPPEFKLIGLYTSQTARLVEKNLKKRGFSIPYLMRKGVGYCATGKYAGRIIIPYYENGQLRYFNARKFIDIGEKFKNPTKDECGVGKAEVIYNIDALDLYERIWLFESTTNALTIGDSAIGTGGKSLSPWQKNKILQSPVKDVLVGLDDDAYIEALKLGLELCNFKRVKVLKFPPKKDANVLGKKKTKELAKATPFLSYNELYKLYINEKRAIDSY